MPAKTRVEARSSLLLAAHICALPLSLLLACAPGKGTTGGIGCSKTSSILKTSQIRTTEAPFEQPSDTTHRNRVIKLFGTEDSRYSSTSFLQSSTGGLKTSGGYMYLNSRKKGDPLGKLKDQEGKTVGELSRCSVLVEFPKTIGDVAPPDSGATHRFPQTASEIEAFRFPAANEDVKKIRLYTAAHCLDYSIADSARLSLFKVMGDALPSPSDAYLDVPIKIPELEAIKNLRKEIKKKILAGAVSESDGEKILNSFRPTARNLDRIFGTDGATSRGKCNIKPENVTDSTEQFSCATYHDMAVLDVEISEQIPIENMTALKTIRSKWIEKLKEEEGKGPWSEYVKPPFSGGVANMPKLFIDSVMSSSVDSSYKSDAGKTTHPTLCQAFPSYKTDTSCTDIPPNPFVTGDLGTPCHRLNTKLGLFRPSPDNCLEVSINSSQNLAFVRYIARERLRNFSRYNMSALVSELGSGLSTAPLNLHQCNTPDGICSLTAAINKTLEELVPGLSLAQVSTQFQQDYQTATKFVDASLSVWNPFFALANGTTVSSAPENVTDTAISIDKNFLKELINPIDFLKLHSNFIILDDQVNTLPEATDTTTHRAFMMVPMPSVVGVDSFFGAGSSKPIAIENWTANDAGSGFGKFLSLSVKKSTLDSFFTNSVNGFDDAGFSPSTPPPGLSIPPSTAIFVNSSALELETPLPSRVTLQKGDSGSIFTLDSIPAFALSTVNGEPTSGGAAVAAIPIPDEDVEDVMPGGPSGGSTGSKTAAVSCK